MNLSNLNLNSLNLSDRAESLLEHVLESEQEGHYDERGYYCEFDSYDCKPWNPESVLELLDLNLVTLHPESDTVDRRQKCGGVAFLKVNLPYFLSLNLEKF
mgnify:FL=1